MQIREFNFGQNGLVETASPLSIPELEQFPKKKRKPRSVASDKYRGKTTGLSVPRYLEQVLIKNEYLAVKGKPLIDPQIRYAVHTEFPRLSPRHFELVNTTLPAYRRKYNTGIMFPDQNPPVLASFRYGTDGYVVAQPAYTRHLSWNDCYDLCLNMRIVDPRFFTEEQILLIRRLKAEGLGEWANANIPTDHDIWLLKNRFKRPPFDTLKFPEGLGRTQE